MESASYHTFGHGVRRICVLPIEAPLPSFPVFLWMTLQMSAIWKPIDALDFSVEHISMYERVLKRCAWPSQELRLQ